MSKKGMSKEREDARKASNRMLLWTFVGVAGALILVLGLQALFGGTPAESGGGSSGEEQGTRVETRPMRVSGANGLRLGDGEFTSEDGYYTIASNDRATVVYDASQLDQVFDEASSDVTLADLDVAIDGNDHIPDGFKPIAHDYCVALVGKYPNVDLRVLLHNLQQLSVSFEDEKEIEEEAGQQRTAGYFDRTTHKIALPTGEDYSADGWGRQAAYHELVHATRLYYHENDDGTVVRVEYEGPDDQTTIAGEALTSLVAESLLDEPQDYVSYQRYCNYLGVAIDSLDDYDLNDFFAHSSQWLTRKLDQKLGTQGGQLFLELMQLEDDDLSDGDADAPATSLDPLYDRLCDLYFGGRIGEGTTYQQAQEVADELGSKLSQNLGDPEDVVDVDRIGHDLRERCRDVGVEGVPDDQPDDQDEGGASSNGGGSAQGDDPQGVRYLASYTKTPEATYEVLAYGSQGGGATPGQNSDKAYERNHPLAGERASGGGQYLALYKDGACRLFETADGRTADVKIGYWDADDEGGLRNFTLSDAYYDEGVFQDQSGTFVATGSSRVTMLCEPTDFDVCALKPYHTAERGRHEQYEEHSAFDGGWSLQSVKLAGWVDEELADNEYTPYTQYETYEFFQQNLESLARTKAGVTSLASSVEGTINDGGYQRLYIDGGSLWRMASDASASRVVLEGRFRVSSLAEASCGTRSHDDMNPFGSDYGQTVTFQLVDEDTLVENRGSYLVTYKRDPSVGDPRGSETDRPEVKIANGRVSVGDMRLTLPSGYSPARYVSDGIAFESADGSVRVTVRADLPMPTDDLSVSFEKPTCSYFEQGQHGFWDRDWESGPVDIAGAQEASRGTGTYLYANDHGVTRCHALVLRKDGYTYYAYAYETPKTDANGGLTYPHEDELEAMLGSVEIAS